MLRRPLVRLLIGLSALSAAPAFAADAARTAPGIAVVSREHLQADLSVLRRAFETLHPGLWRYQTPDQFARRFEGLRRTLDRPMRRDSAFVEIARFAASVRCGHTFAGPYNQGRLVTAELVRRGGRVPFHFVWIARRMVVTRDLTADARLPRGTEVMSVQGVRAADLLLRMMPFVGADGSNDAKRVSALEVQGRSAYESFDLFLPLLLDGVEERLELRVRFPGEQAVRAISVAPLDWEDRKRDHDAREEGSGGLPWSLDFSDSAFALLRMDSWAVYNSGVNWDSTLNAMLDRVVDSGRMALVVDLRNNAGGLDCGDVILQRLVRDTTRFELERRFVRYRRTPADLDSSLDTWDDSFRDFTADTPESPGPDGLYPFGGGEGDAFGVIVPKGRPFHGRVYVLVGPANSSATFQFASQVRSAGLGKLVGRPTGGNQRGINGGRFFFLRLPHSRIEVDLPLVAYFPPRPLPDAGLRPDVLVGHTVEGVAAGSDPELDSVRRMLWSKWSKR